MYEEKNNFSVRTIILQILAIVLFVLIMIWLFPTKDYADGTYVTKDTLLDSLQSIYGRNFASNIESMRDAAKDYFTNERLPKKVGESVTLTLGEMQDKKLVLTMIDSNNQACNTTKSYVTVTKMDNEYQMKIQLSCTDYSDYIIDYLGCYDYCDTCNKPNNNTNNNTKKDDTKKDGDDPTPTPTPTKKYKYEYRKSFQNEYSAWSDWSSWSTTKATADNFTQVEIKTEKVIDGYTKDYKITGYKTVEYKDWEEKEVTKYVTETYTEQVPEEYKETEYYTEYEYSTNRVQIGTERKLTDSVSATYHAESYGAWYNAGTITTKDEIKYSNSTVQYELRDTSRALDCSNSCRYITTRVYTVKKRNYTAAYYSCPNGYTLEGTTCNKYEDVPVYKDEQVSTPVTKSREVTKVRYNTVTKTRQVPVTTHERVEVTKTRQEPVYGYVNGDPIYKEVTYYRFRTRTQTQVAGVDYKWSESQNDETLLSQGYTLTGNKKEM